MVEACIMHAPHALLCDVSWQVWRPGVDPVGEDEDLDYDPTAYDCLHRMQLDWPSLRWDMVAGRGLNGRS